MAINLSKGQRVSLDKGVRLALVGLGWDTNRYDGSADFDLDASAFLLGANGKVRSDDDFIFYGNLQSKDGSVSFLIPKARMLAGQSVDTLADKPHSIVSSPASAMWLVSPIQSILGTENLLERHSIMMHVIPVQACQNPAHAA